MRKIKLQKINYFGKCKYEVKDSIYGFTSNEGLLTFSKDLDFGKAYLIKGELFHGSFALSYIIAGRVKEKFGKILIDDRETSQKERTKLSCIAGECPKKYKNRTIKKILKAGLIINNRQEEYDSIIKKYDLIDREDRRFEHLSFHKWLASLAIADCFQKNIICFPYVTGEYFINTSYVNGEFQSIFQEFKNKGTLIIIPTDAEDVFKNIVDEVIIMRDYNHT